MAHLALKIDLNNVTLHGTWLVLRGCPGQAHSEEQSVKPLHPHAGKPCILVRGKHDQQKSIKQLSGAVGEANREILVKGHQLPVTKLGSEDRMYSLLIIANDTSMTYSQVAGRIDLKCSHRRKKGEFCYSGHRFWQYRNVSSHHVVLLGGSVG